MKKYLIGILSISLVLSVLAGISVATEMSCALVARMQAHQPTQVMDVTTKVDELTLNQLMHTKFAQKSRMNCNKCHNLRDPEFNTTYTKIQNAPCVRVSYKTENGYKPVYAHCFKQFPMRMFQAGKSAVGIHAFNDWAEISDDQAIIKTFGGIAQNVTTLQPFWRTVFDDQTGYLTLSMKKGTTETYAGFQTAFSAFNTDSFNASTFETYLNTDGYTYPACIYAKKPNRTTFIIAIKSQRATELAAEIQLLSKTSIYEIEQMSATQRNLQRYLEKLQPSSWKKYPVFGLFCVSKQ